LGGALFIERLNGIFVGANFPKPRLLVIKGTFEQYGGAERDIIANIPSWKEYFEIELATLHLPEEVKKELFSLDICTYTPELMWMKPTGAFSEITARASRESRKLWKKMPRSFFENFKSVDAVHLVSGVGSLEVIDSIPSHMPIHLHYLEPHRGLHEDVLHKRLNGTFRRPYFITRALLMRARRIDISFTKKVGKREKTIISSNSPWIAKRMSEVYSLESQVIWPSVASSKWPPNPSPKEEDAWGYLSAKYDLEIGNFVLTIGSASYVKGTWSSLQVLEGTTLIFVHIGGGSQDDLNALKKEGNRLGVRVQSLPSLDQLELVALMRKSRAMISHAVDEPFGLTPIEAQSVGTPAIVVAEGGFCSTVEDGVSGRVIPRDAPKSEWRNALAESADPKKRKKWSISGRKSIKKMGLSPPDQAKRLAESFEKLGISCLR